MLLRISYCYHDTAGMLCIGLDILGCNIEPTCEQDVTELSRLIKTKISVLEDVMILGWNRVPDSFLPGYKPKL